MGAGAHKRVLYKPPTHDLLFPDFSDRISRSRRVGYESGDYEIVSTFHFSEIAQFLSVWYSYHFLERCLAWRRLWSERDTTAEVPTSGERNPGAHSGSRCHPGELRVEWLSIFAPFPRETMKCDYSPQRFQVARVWMLLCGVTLTCHSAFRLQQRKAAQRNGWPRWSWPSRQPNSSSSWFLPTWTRSWARRHTSTWPTQMELWPGEPRRWPRLLGNGSFHTGVAQHLCSPALCLQCEFR